MSQHGELDEVERRHLAYLRAIDRTGRTEGRDRVAGGRGYWMVQHGFARRVGAVESQLSEYWLVTTYELTPRGREYLEHLESRTEVARVRRLKGKLYIWERRRTATFRRMVTHYELTRAGDVVGELHRLESGHVEAPCWYWVVRVGPHYSSLGAAGGTRPDLDDAKVACKAAVEQAFKSVMSSGRPAGDG